MKLSLLLKLQVSYAVLGIGYNIISIITAASAGRALSQNDPVTGIMSLLIYSLVLIPGFMGRLTFYRALACVSIFVFGYGGVVTHILRYPNIEAYYSPATWALAIAINGFGLLLNIAAAAGLFKVGEDKTLSA